MTAKQQRVLSTQELLALAARAEHILTDFRILPENNCNSAEFGMRTSLRNLSLPSGIRSVNVELVNAAFKPKADPVEDLSRIALLAEPNFKQFGYFEVKCFFKPGGFEGSKRPDVCGILFWREKLLISYECRIESAQLRKEYFKRLISRTGLPVRMSEDQRGYYLHHAQNGMLRPLSGGGYDENPTAFWCEMTNPSVLESFPFIRAAIDKAHVNVVEWTIIPGEGKQLDLDVVLAQDFPSTAFEFNFTYTLENLNVLEQLQAMKISQGYFVTYIASFKWNDRLSILSVRTNPRGHILYADIEPNALEELNQKLGLTLLPYD